MKEICEYKLLVESKAEDLNKKVNQLISDSWQLYGTPFRATQSGFDYVAQAVVKYKE